MIHKMAIAKIDVSDGKVHRMEDHVAEEKRLDIFLNRTHYATIFCSPTNLKELAIGHLLSEGIIKSIEEIDMIVFKGERTCYVALKSDIDLGKRLKMAQRFSRVIVSACGGPYQPSRKLPRIKSNLRVEAELLSNCVNQLNSVAQTFRKTGGVHAAAIHRSDGSLVGLAEDVGRHNAVDKIIGLATLARVDFKECFLVLSGRLTGDVVFKAARVGLPVVASLAAALDSGIAIAKEVDLTLIGFVRGKRMNVYSFPERILLS